MCWGVYVAISDCKQLPDFTARPSSDPDVNLGAWPVDNPWIPLVFGDLWCGWIVGHANYCSCGCVTSTRNRQTVGLTQPVRNYVADVADDAGLIGLGVHWTGGEFSSEELPFDIRGAIFADQLRMGAPFVLIADSFYWVHSRTRGRPGS